MAAAKGGRNECDVRAGAEDLNNRDLQELADTAIADILAQPTPRDALAELVSAHFRSDPAFCVTVFEGALARLDVTSYWLYYMVSAAYLELGKPEPAYLLAALAEKLEAGASSWHLYSRMFRYHASRRRYRDAIAVLLKQLGTEPERPIAGIDEMMVLFKSYDVPIPGASYPRASDTPSKGRRVIRVVDESVLNLNIPVPLGGKAALALRSLQPQVTRPAITITELNDATVLIQDDAILVLDCENALHEKLSVTSLPGAVIAKFLRLKEQESAFEESSIGEAVILKDQFSSRNLCHFMFDYLTRLELYRRAGADITSCAVITGTLSDSFMKELASAFGIGVVIPTTQRLRLRVGRLFVSDNCKETFRHPAHLASPWAIASIRTTLGARDDDAGSLRLYISRRDAPVRKIRNEEEVTGILDAAGFRHVVASELTHAEQVKLFRRASHVIGLHGAGLANIVFCPPRTNVLEILHPVGNTPAYALVAAGANLSYAAIAGVDADEKGPIWNDPSLTDTAREEAGGREAMNHRDVYVCTNDLELWLDQVLPNWRENKASQLTQLVEKAPEMNPIAIQGRSIAPIDWDLFAEIRRLVDSHHPAAALDRIAQSRQEHGDLAAPLIVLQAYSYCHLGRHREAVNVCEEVIARGDPNEWTWHALAQAHRELGNWSDVFDANRQAHALAGWPESRERMYRFTHDYLTGNLANWATWFDQYVTAAPLRALEIGSWQGASACWLLDRVIGARGGRLTCIDTFEGSSEHASFLSGVLAGENTTLERLFDENIARTGRAEHIRKIVGLSQDVLPGLHGERFDFIYIDGSHEAKYVIQDAVLCWGLLEPGGYMLFDDVPFRFPNSPAQDTVRAIDFFLSVFTDEVDVLARDWQLLLRRALPDPS